MLTVAAAQIAGLPDGRLFGSGCVLDSARLRWLIGERAGVSQQSVHAMMVGEHGDTEFPLWSQAKIGTVPLREWTDTDGDRLFSGESAPPSTTRWCMRRTRSSPARARPTTRSG